MEIILKHSDFIEKIIGMQKFDSNTKYRMLIFCIVENLNDYVLIFNLMTKELIRLKKSEYTSILNKETDSPIYTELVNHWFLVPEATDDAKLNQQIENISIPFINRFVQNHYTIATTLDCNARCFYCFEHDSNRESMSIYTAHKISEYIKKNSKGSPVVIEWFGGEPLYNHKVIDVISNDLKNKNVEFKSTMISNGYLFDEEIINRAKNKWNLKLVQITLDGTEKIYNKTKAYIYENNINPFVKVLHNIHLLLNAKIYVKIRTNMGIHNVNDLYELVDLIYAKFGTNKYLQVYSQILFDGCGVGKRVKNFQERNFLAEEHVKLEKYIYMKGYSNNLYLNKQIRPFRCMADNDHSIMILPNGNLSKCERYTNENNLGNIETYSFDSSEYSKWKERVPYDSECGICPLLPECKRLKKCPHEKYFICDEFERMKRINRIKAAMQNEYEKYCKK